MGWPFGVRCRALNAKKVQELLGESVNLAVLGSVITAVLLTPRAPWWLPRLTPQLTDTTPVDPSFANHGLRFEEGEGLARVVKRRRLGGASTSSNR